MRKGDTWAGNCGWVGDVADVLPRPCDKLTKARYEKESMKGGSGIEKEQL